MPAMIADLYRSPMVRAIILWHLGWGAVALATDAKFLIEVLNGLMLAVAVGVIVAYLPNVVQACRLRHPAGDDILVVGIWLAWVSLVEARIWSITWRSIGAPGWLVNTDFTTHILAVALLAGIFHLAGPEAINGRIPTRQWLRIGIIVAVGMMLAFGLMLTVGETGAILRSRR